MKKQKSWLITFASIAILATTIVVFQNCSGNFAALQSSSMSSRGMSALSTAIDGRFTFSKDYYAPAVKNGTGDAKTVLSAGEFDQRYAKLKSLGVQYRQYNFWWSALEGSGVTSSAAALACPAGYTLYPANEGERGALGYHKYHCYSNDTVAMFDNLFTRDQNNGMQSSIVMWSSPTIYRYPDCEGFAFGGGYLKDGCVPRDDAMDDFEDYANFIASRYNGGSHGKVSSFIVWNENASSEWMDYSPISARRDLSQAAIDRRLDKISDMMKRVHAALTRHQHAAMMYVSTDQLWQSGQGEGHIGTRTLLEGVWARLGINYSWGVAVHPYGNVDAPAGSNIYTFNNLEMVANYQKSKLRALGVNDTDSFPQSRLIASEQGWPISNGTNQLEREGQARQICLAHDKVMSMPSVMAVGHNYFQSTEPQEDTGGSSGQGAFFGLIPHSVANSLDGMENTPTGKAFASTFRIDWGAANDHFCCRVYSLGCASPRPQTIASVNDTHQVIGNIDGVSTINGKWTISGWACNVGREQPIGLHLYMNGPAGGGGTYLGQFGTGLGSEPAINDQCKATGSAYRFQISIDDTTIQNFGGKKIYIHGISQLGLSNNLLNGSGVAVLPVIQAPSAPASTGAFPIYRFIKGKTHLWTSTYSEGTNGGFTFERVAFNMLPASSSIVKNEIWRCSTPDVFFFSSAANCEGQHADGIIGYLARNPEGGTNPVYRYKKDSTGQHLITVDKNEAEANGFTFESILGYAY